MVGPDDLGCPAEIADAADDAVPDLGMLVHDRLFLAGPAGPALRSTASGMPILPMSWRSAPQYRSTRSLPRNAERVADDQGKFGHPERMAADLVLAGVDGGDEGLEGDQVARFHAVNDAVQIGVR